MREGERRWREQGGVGGEGGEGEEGGEVAHLDVEHHGEGGHRDDKCEAEEEEIQGALAHDRGGEARLGADLRGELQHFEEL